MALVILFGPTGAGKTYIGKLLAKEFAYHFYDGDADLTAEMKRSLHTMKPITDAMRDRFMERLLRSIKGLANHDKLVIAQTFIKEKYRNKLLKSLPQAKFVLVKTKPNIRYVRRQQRADYPWDKAYVKKMDAIFETPKIPYQVITNDSTGSTHLKACLLHLLSELS